MRSLKFIRSPETLSRIKENLSPERLSSYLDQNGGDLKAAIHLYEHNTNLSAAFYRPLQGLEVVLRNAIQNQLAKGFQRQDWYDDPIFLEILQSHHKNALNKARNALARENKPISPGGIVAELSFGFWTGLLGPKYAVLWNRYLYQSFPNKKLQRKQCHKSLNRIRRFRNRIAHHEPILSRDLEYDHRLIIEIISWIDPIAAQWVNQTSHFQQTFRKTLLQKILGRLCGCR
ncbi:MAG: Abi family protein [Magnetococcales bacterium]|nr:Abi family protein [Magnetococcales bacterium]